MDSQVGASLLDEVIVNSFLAESMLNVNPHYIETVQRGAFRSVVRAELFGWIKEVRKLG
jgi:hypothetical protein